MAWPPRRATARGRMRVIRKRARDIKTRAHEAENFFDFFRGRGFELLAGACRSRTRETGPWRLAAVRENEWTYAFAQFRGIVDLVQ